MNKILRLLIDDYQNHAISAEYKLVLEKACIMEKAFVNSLNIEQKKAYSELDIAMGELSAWGQNELAEYLFDNFKKHF